MSKSLVPVQFDLSVLPTVQEIGEVVQNNLEGDIQLNFPEIKIPSGGGISWEVPTESDDPKTTAELIGVLLDYHPFNIYFESAYTGEKSMPTCVSRDGVTGEGSPGGLCKACKLGGDDAWGTGKDGIGKACANKIRIALLMQGDIFPYSIALPPTSIRNFKDYLNALTNKLKAYQSVITKIKLVKEKSSGGITYSQAVFSKVADLEKADAGRMLAYAKTLRPFIRKAKVGGEVVEEAAPVRDDAPDGVYDNDTGEPINGDGWN